MYTQYCKTGHACEHNFLYFVFCHRILPKSILIWYYASAKNSLLTHLYCSRCYWQNLSPLLNGWGLGAWPASINIFNYESFLLHTYVYLLGLRRDSDIKFFFYQETDDEQERADQERKRATARQQWGVVRRYVQDRIKQRKRNRGGWNKDKAMNRLRAQAKISLKPDQVRKELFERWEYIVTLSHVTEVS